MAGNYSEYLAQEIDKAEAEFKQAKADVIREIEGMTAHGAVDYGAAYYSKIDRITNAAARLKALAEAKHVYDFFIEKEAKA